MVTIDVHWPYFTPESFNLDAGFVGFISGIGFRAVKVWAYGFNIWNSGLEASRFGAQDLRLPNLGWG